MTRFSVPLFVVISGALFLAEEREYTIKKLWKNNILRLFILYVVWSFAYYVYQSMVLWDFAFWKAGIVRTVVGCVYASTHFWFLFMIMGLYALVPMLRTWLKQASQREELYVIGLFFGLQIVRYSVQVLLDKSLVDAISSLLEVTELSGYLGYFILGHYLTKYGLKKWQARTCLALALLGIPLNYLSSYFLSVAKEQYYGGISDSYGIFVFFQCIAVYYYMTKVFAGKQLPMVANYLITNVGKDTLGIYVIHICMLWELQRRNWFPSSWSTPALIFAYGISCYVLCCLLAAVLRRIPIIGKYLS